jgi:hypothetical protein
MGASADAVSWIAFTRLWHEQITIGFERRVGNPAQNPWFRKRRSQGYWVPELKTKTHRTKPVVKPASDDVRAAEVKTILRLGHPAANQSYFTS